MAEYTTKQLFDMFFAQKDQGTAYKTRSQIDRPEVYAYEEKIGKQLVDMDVDELFEMILTFNGDRRASNTSYSISYSSYDQIASLYRTFFNFYIDTVRVIRNPFNDKRMRGSAAAQRLAQGKEPFSMKIVDDLIAKIYVDFGGNRAKYIECIMRLYLEGFSNASEIVLLKEDMINTKNRSIVLLGRTLYVSEKCFRLLQEVHNMEDMEGWRGDYVVVAWHDYYFKYITRPRGVDELQKWGVPELANTINRTLTIHVKNKYGVDVNYRMLYMLGFYEHLVKQFGAQRSYELITAVRDPVATEELMGAARSYNMSVENVTILKKQLRPFIKI